MVNVTVQSIPISVTVQDQSPISLTIGGVSVGGTGGEVNTASNIGLAGVGLYDSKSGVNLNFRNIEAGNNTTVTIDVTNNAVKIDSRGPYTGTETLAFGSFPGSNTAQVSVTGQTEISASDIVSLTPIYSTDENRLVSSLIDFSVSTPIAGDGFTIYAISQQMIQGNISIGWRY